MSDCPSEMLNIEELAANLNAGEHLVYRRVASRKLAAVKLRGVWRFRRGDLDQWIVSRMDKAMADDDGEAE